MPGPGAFVAAGVAQTSLASGRLPVAEQNGTWPPGSPVHLYWRWFVCLSVYIIAACLPILLIPCVHAYCVSACRPVAPSVCRSVGRSVGRSAFACRSACLSASALACRHVGMSASLSNCRSVCLSACLHYCLSACRSVAPSVCRSVGRGPSACRSSHRVNRTLPGVAPVEAAHGPPQGPSTTREAAASTGTRRLSLPLRPWRR